jgi:hypothetical protein
LEDVHGTMMPTVFQLDQSDLRDTRKYIKQLEKANKKLKERFNRIKWAENPDPSWDEG